MTDDEWQQYRNDYATNHNIYLADLPEVRAQHDAYPGLSEALDEQEEEETVYPSLTVIEGVTGHENAPEWQVVVEDDRESTQAPAVETEQQRLLKLMGTSINNSEKKGE